MIPKKIHYCWFGGEEEPEMVKRCLDSWDIILEDYTIKKWDESNIPKGINYLDNALKHKKYSNMSNYIRLYATYTEGGIYLDTDIEMLRTFEPLLKESCFVGYESSSSLNSAVLGSKKELPFLKELLSTLVSIHNGTEQSYLSGPVLLTKYLHSKGYCKPKNLPYMHKNILICPQSYFYPYSWNEPFYQECVKDDTYCIHRWTKLW